MSTVDPAPAGEHGGSRRPTYLFVLIVGLCSTALFVALAVRGVDLAAIGRRVGDADLLPWIPLGVASYLTGHILRGWRCKLLVSRDATISILEGTNTVVVGYAANNILPARLGELVRAGMLSDRSGLPLVQSLAVIFVERVFDGLALVLMLLVAEATAPNGQAVQSRRLAIALFCLAAAAVLSAVVCRGRIMNLASRLASRLSAARRDAVLRASAAIVSGVAYLSQLRRTFSIVALSLGVWLCEAGLFYALLPALQIPASISTALLAASVTNLGILLPSAPGFIGPFEYFCMEVLILTGVARALALSYAVLVHLTFLIPVTIWGLGVLLARGAGFGWRFAVIRRAQAVRLPDVPRATPIGAYYAGPSSSVSSPFLHVLVDALVPPPIGAAHEHERAVDATAQFISGQLAALPSQLRLMMRAGLAGFRVVTVLRFGRGVTQLDAATRRDWIDAWAYGPVPMTRLLFRGVRTLAFLAYYEETTASGRNVSAGRAAVRYHAPNVR